MGTVCRACGVQYWTTGRLSRHLRDTPQCVSTLYDSGHRAPVIAPGVGSRARRESDIDDFHPAAPQRACTPVEQSVDDYWDDVQKAAHAELCDMLLVPTLIPSWTATLGAIQAVLAKFPLYYEEARDIANFVKSEVVAVGPELLEEFWTPEVKSAVEQALETFVEQEWPLPEEAKGPRQPPPTFEDSKGEIPEYDWPHLVLKVTALYGTRPPSAWTLPSDWKPNGRRVVLRLVLRPCRVDFGHGSRKRCKEPGMHSLKEVPFSLRARSRSGPALWQSHFLASDNLCMLN